MRTNSLNSVFNSGRKTINVRFYNRYTFSINWVYWLTFSVFYLSAGIYFAEARTLFLDNAFQVFRLIQDDAIVINAYRWPAAVYRLAPLIAIRLGLDLGLVLHVFSVSYALVPILGAAYLLLGLRDVRSAFLLITLVSLPLVHGFFWCNSELFLAIQMSVLLWAAISHRRWIISKMLAICLAWTHPLSFILVMFPFFFQLADRCRYSFMHYFILVLYSINYLVKSFFFKNWYDTIKQRQLSENLNTINRGILEDMLDYVLHVDPVLIVTMLLTFLFLVYRRRWTQTILYLSSIFSLCFIFCLTADTAMAPEFYTELNNYLLYFISLYILAREFQQIPSKESKPNSWALILVLILAFSAVRWYRASGFYTQRIDWIEQKVTKYDRHLFIGQLGEGTPLVLPWASAYESLLISSLRGKSGSFTYTDNAEKAQFEGRDDILVTEYRIYSIPDLDRRYFPLTQKPYTLVYLD